MLNLDDLSRLKGHRFPRTVIGYAVWAYHRFALSLRDVEDHLAERGVFVSYETIRVWVAKFGTQIAAKIRRDRPGPADKWHLDEVVLKINGVKQWLWRAIDANGDVLDILVQSRRNTAAAKRFMRKLFKRWGLPRVMVTDKLGILSRREGGTRPRRGASPAQGDQQRGRNIAPAHPQTGEGHGAVQVTATGAAVPVGPRSDRRHLPPPPSPPLRPFLPPRKTGRVRPVGGLHDRTVRVSGGRRHLVRLHKTT